MGLTVHYDLKLGPVSAAEARRALERLHRRAKKLPFAWVEPVHEIVIDRDEDAWPDGLQLVRCGELYYDVLPTRGFQFHTQPGEGTEWATFGLCEYPKTTAIGGGRRIRTKLTGWCWHSFCKTQYASNPKYGGVENFLKAHIALIELLDYAGNLGLETKVHDEGEYAERRNIDALREEVADWNGLVAGMVGVLKDAIPLASEAPILDYPDFERLEAKGRSVE